MGDQKKACCCEKKPSETCAPKPVSGLSKQAEDQGRAIMALMRRLSHVGYAGSLGMQDAELSVVKGGVQTVHTVPQRLCMADGTLPCGILAGWIDEVSSLAFVIMDKGHRPGVSVALFTEVLRPVYVGDRIRLVSLCLKAGKSLGYADAILTNQHGLEVARGRHVKFLSMGKGWDVAMQPWAFPITTWLAGRSVEQTQHKAEAAVQKDPSRGPFELAGLLRLEDLRPSHSTKQMSAPPMGQEMGQTSGSGAWAAEADVAVSPWLCNSYGTMHGGAVALLFERAAVLLLQYYQHEIGGARLGGGATRALTGMRAQSGGVHYLSPLRGKLRVVVTLPAPPNAAGVCTVSACLYDEGDRLASYGSVLMEPPPPQVSHL